METPSENEKQDRIKSLLACLGGQSKNPIEANLKKLAAALSKDVEAQIEFIQDTLVQCVIHLTHKTGIYATLVGLLNLSHAEFGRRMVKSVEEEFELALSAKDYAKVAILTKFLAELGKANVVPVDDFLQILHGLLDIAVHKETAAKVSDFFYYCVFGALPYFGKFLHKKSPEQLSNLLNRLKRFSASAERRSLEQNYLHALGEKTSFVDLLFAAVMAAEADEFFCEAVAETSHYFGDEFAKSQSHPLSFSVDLKFVATFKNDDGPSFCPLLSIAENSGSKLPLLSQLILFEFYSDVILYFDDNIKHCARELLLITEQRNCYDLLVESVFSLVLQNPKPQSNPVVCNRVMAELFSAQPILIPRIFTRAVENLFSKLDVMDIESSDRFADFFALHLSNFKFRWTWSNWNFVLGLAPQKPQRVFCDSVLRQCQEASAPKIQTDREGLTSLLPPDIDKPCFLYADAISAATSAAISAATSADRSSPIEESCPKEGENAEKSPVLAETGETMAAKLFSAVSEKQPDEAVESLVKAAREALGGEKALALFFGCLLLAGAPRLSDLFRLFDRYKPLVLRLAPGAGEKAALARTALGFWRESHLRLRVVLQKLVTYGFMSPVDVAAALVGEEGVAEFHKPFYSSILTSLLDLYTQRVHILKNFLGGGGESAAAKEKAVNKEELLDRITSAVEDRKTTLRLILASLAAAVGRLENGGAAVESHLQLRMLFGRYVMFLRKYRGLVRESAEEFRSAIASAGGGEEGRCLSPLRAFRAIVSESESN